MHNTVKNLLDIENNIKAYLNKLILIIILKLLRYLRLLKSIKFYLLIEYGHIDYGENKVQEAVEKWTEIKKKIQK